MNDRVKITLYGSIVAICLAVIIGSIANIVMHRINHINPKQPLLNVSLNKTDEAKQNNLVPVKDKDGNIIEYRMVGDINERR